MKKTLFSILILLAFILSACDVSQTNTPDAQTMPGSDELPEITKLVIGTLSLKDTGNAITPEQAQELLPLWQVYLSLLSSDAAAQEEIDALVEQIGETMTAEQTQAIEAMQLSQEDMLTVIQENGMGGNRLQGQGNNGSSRSNGFTPSGGGSFGGGFPEGGNFTPPDGGGFPSDGIPSGDQIPAGQPAPGLGGGGVPTPLIQAVIDYLQKIAGS